LIEKKKAIRDGALEDLVSGKTRLDGFNGEWEEGIIGDILTILHGRNQHSVESRSGKYPILGTGGVMGKAAEYLCNWECVLIGRKGTINVPMYMNTPFWTIDTLYYSKPKANQCAKFQYYLFCRINWVDYAESSGRPSLAKKVIESIFVNIPKYDEQQSIASILTTMDEEIQSLETEKAKMIEIK
ncbi:MAG: restriction endonuclease subunit S, partial [Anaerovoracaceae bacterium]